MSRSPPDSAKDRPDAFAPAVSISHSIDREKDRLAHAFRMSLRAVGILLLLHLLRLLLGMPAATWGIIPREMIGLHGILTAPLAHGNWGHLANNAVPIFATVFLLTYFYRKIAARAMLIMYVLTGVFVWLLARGAGWGADYGISHVGASGVAYAFVSFLFWMGVFKRSVQSIIVALIILLYFSGMIAGILPDQLNVSWESHLIGGVVGMGVAWGFRQSLVAHEADRQRPVHLAQPYFPPDIFTYTMAEREAMRQAALEAERQRLLAEQQARHDDWQARQDDWQARQDDWQARQ